MLTQQTTTSIDVVVAVLTYRRPDQLRTLLPQLDRQSRELEQAFSCRSTILVVDNDPDGSAASLAATVSGVRYVHEPIPGIAAGRARAVDEAGGADVVVFIDDDEEPMPGWLANLVRTWIDRGRPAGVAGRIAPTYDGVMDPWIEAGGFFRRRRYATGTVVHAASSANLLLDLGSLRDRGLNFDSRLGLRGGEDTLLTSTLTRNGAPVVWCDEAAVIDHIPPSRMSRRWVLRRAFSHGSVASRTELAFTGGSLQAKGRLAIAAAARIGAGTVAAMAGVAAQRLRWRARGWRLVYKGAGMLAGAVGRDVTEYRR